MESDWMIRATLTVSKDAQAKAEEANPTAVGSSDGVTRITLVGPTATIEYHVANATHEEWETFDDFLETFHAKLRSLAKEYREGSQEPGD